MIEWLGWVKRFWNYFIQIPKNKQDFSIELAKYSVTINVCQSTVK